MSFQKVIDWFPIDTRTFHSHMGAIGRIEPVEQLKQLASLKDQGVLTDEEFNAEKQKVLEGA